ncbi:hypothetical protein Leryth_025749 [Lithospermum erythrorhizon]|nr:hypothetical protein Leryth_025749 [Lithospermum erythrorhizon]
MSEAFEQYERQYCELSANLSKKCTSVHLLDGELKKQKLSEIKVGIDEAESMIRKMDLEARSLQPNIKAVLLAKLREYKSDLNNLKSEVKQIISKNLNASARDELLESGMADTLTVLVNFADIIELVNPIITIVFKLYKLFSRDTLSIKTLICFIFK